MISIQTNVNSLIAQQNLSVNSAFQSKTIAQLTSGYRINQSGDDAAGLAVANKFRSTVAELTQGVANGNDATAQLQIMDGGMRSEEHTPELQSLRHPLCRLLLEKKQCTSVSGAGINLASGNFGQAVSPGLR